MEQASLHVAGMWCSNCARAVERGLSRQDAVGSARVSFASKIAVISYDATLTSIERLSKTIEDTGYRVAPLNLDGAALAKLDQDVLTGHQVRLALGIVPGMWVMTAQASVYLTEISPDVQFWISISEAVLSAVVVFVAGWKILLAGWRTLRVLVPGMDALVSIAAIGAWSLSVANLAAGRSDVWFDTACFLILAVSAGRLLEHAVRERGLDAVRQLLSLSPDEAERLDAEGVGVRVGIAELVVGDRLRVRPGEAFGVDVRVVEGRSMADRSLLTGESMPVALGPGDIIEAGCTNLHGALVVVVVAEFGDRKLDHIAHQVQEAMDQKVTEPSIAQRFSELLAPVVMGLSLLTGLVLVATGTPPTEAVLRMVTVLVISCPCALGLAVPLAMAVAVGRAAKLGVLFRDAEALEAASTVDTVVFDKTGTLTQGRPVVTAWGAVQPYSEADTQRLAAGAAALSPHSLSWAIRHALACEGQASGTHIEVPGLGVEWTTAEGQTVRFGSEAWMVECGLVVPGVDDASFRPTRSWVALGDAMVGWVDFHDPIRPGVANVVASLRARGIASWVLSGDGGPVVEALCGGLGFEVVEGDCTPQYKAKKVSELMAQGCFVAFVGDGFNDAPALGVAHLGIAVHGATSATQGAANITLQSPGVARVAFVLSLGRAARRVMRQNLGWAMAYNALAIPLAMSGQLRPAMAAVAMIFSSITVSLNSLRLHRIDQVGSPPNISK